MNVLLTKEWSSGKGTRTTEIYGETLILPLEGQSFRMLADPLELDKTDGVRYVETSKVVYVKKLDDGFLRFYTENSVYTLEVMSSVDKMDGILKSERYDE